MHEPPLTWGRGAAAGPWGERLGTVADGIARGAGVLIVSMLRAEGEVQRMGAIVYTQRVGACLRAPAVNHVVPLLHGAGQHYAAVSILQGLVQHRNFWSGDLLCHEGRKGVITVMNPLKF